MPTSSEALRLIRKYTDYVPSGPTLYRGPVPLPNVEIKRPTTLPSVTICDVRGLTCYNQSRDGDSCSSDVRRVPSSMLQGASHKKLPPIHVPVGSTGSHPQPCLESPSLADVRTGEREKGDLLEFSTHHLHYNNSGSTTDSPGGQHVSVVGTHCVRRTFDTSSYSEAADRRDRSGAALDNRAKQESRDCGVVVVGENRPEDKCSLLSPAEDGSTVERGDNDLREFSYMFYNSYDPAPYVELRPRSSDFSNVKSESNHEELSEPNIKGQNLFGSPTEHGGGDIIHAQDKNLTSKEAKSDKESVEEIRASIVRTIRNRGLEVPPPPPFADNNEEGEDHGLRSQFGQRLTERRAERVDEQSCKTAGDEVKRLAELQRSYWGVHSYDAHQGRHVWRLEPRSALQGHVTRVTGPFSLPPNNRGSGGRDSSQRTRQNRAPRQLVRPMVKPSILELSLRHGPYLRLAGVLDVSGRQINGFPYNLPPSASASPVLSEVLEAVGRETVAARASASDQSLGFPPRLRPLATPTRFDVLGAMDRETPGVMASVSDQSLATQLRWLHESTAPFTNSPEVRLSKSWNLLAGPDSTRPLAGEIQKAAELEAEPPTRSSSVPQLLLEGGPADEVSSKSYNYNGQELDLPTQQQKSESEAQTSSGQTKTKLSSSCKDLPENLNGLENSLLRDGPIHRESPNLLRENPKLLREDPRQDAGRFLLDDDMIIIEHEYLADVIRVAPQTSGKEIRRLHTIKEEGGDSGNERKPVQSTTSSSAQKSTRRRLRSQTSFNRLRLSRHPKQQAALKKPVVKATDISKTQRGRKVFRRVAQSILDDIDCNIINVNDFVDEDDDIGDGAYTDDEGEDDNDNRSGIAYGDYRNRNISILRTKAVSPPSIMELQRQMGGQGKLQKPPPIDPAARDSESSKKLAEDAFLRRVGSRILRHRRPPPAPQPGKLCLAKGVADLTHAEVKDGLEGQGKVKLSLLQFDPVYLRGLTPAEACTCRWIFELTPDSDPDLLLGKGLRMRGSHVGVRYLDDQLRDEHHAYLMFFAFCNRLKSSRVQKKRKAVSRA